MFLLKMHRFILWSVPILVLNVCVGATPPVVAFTWVQVPNACGKVQFYNLSYDPDRSGAKLGYYWRFGFGNFVGLPVGAKNPVVVYPAPGTYKVTLRVTKQGTGESAEVTKTISIDCEGNWNPWIHGGSVTELGT